MEAYGSSTVVYLARNKLLTKKFLDKGYPPNSISRAPTEITSVLQEIGPTDKPFFLFCL